MNDQIGSEGIFGIKKWQKISQNEKKIKYLIKNLHWTMYLCNICAMFVLLLLLSLGDQEWHRKE